MDVSNVENMDFLELSFEERCRYLYEYAISVDFDYYKTDELCKKLKLIGFFEGFNLRWFIKEEKGYEYVGHPEVYMIANEIINKRKDSKIEADKIKNYNPALLKIGIEYKGLWRNEEEKILVLNYVLDVYNRFTYKACNMLMAEFNTSSKTINKIYSEAIDVLVLNGDLSNKAEVMSERRMKANFDKKMDTSEKFKAYEKLLTTNDEEEIIKIISSLNESFSSLQNCIDTFAVNYAGNTTHIYSNLRSKLKVYSDALVSERKENKAKIKEQEKLFHLTEAQEVVRTFLEDENCTIADFCKEYGIIDREFENFVKLVKEYDEELAKKYDKKISENSKRSFAILSSKINSIIEKIKNGIEINGEIRNFDIIDYYMITKLDFNKILEISRKILDNRDIVVIKKFIATNRMAEKYDCKFEQNILESTTIINVQKDEKGNVIPGTGDIIDIETKKIIILFLKEHNIPLNQKTYNTAFKRYINNTLLIEEEKEYILKRDKANA